MTAKTAWEEFFDGHAAQCMENRVVASTGPIELDEIEIVGELERGGAS